MNRELFEGYLWGLFAASFLIFFGGFLFSIFDLIVWSLILSCCTIVFALIVIFTERFEELRIPTPVFHKTKTKPLRSNHGAKRATTTRRER